MKQQDGMRERSSDGALARPRIRLTSLPVLNTPQAFLREVQPDDVSSLMELVDDTEAWKFMASARPTKEGLLRYVRWARRSRRLGQHVSFGVVPRAGQTAVGLFQIWPLDSDFHTAEWGFALGRPFWGTGMFTECAERIMEFAIDVLGVERLEARTDADDLHSNRALERLGASREGVLRRCFWDGENARDRTMWAIISRDWRTSRQLTQTTPPAPMGTATGTSVSCG